MTKSLAGTAAPPMNIAQLLEKHPYPEQYAKEKRVERLYTFDLPCRADQLWPHIADTSRMNRVLGLAEMQFEEREGKRYGTARPGGVLHSWVEVPWNWVANQWLTCTRLYDRGFMKVMYAIHRVDPLPDDRCRLYLYFGAVPRGLFGGIALRLGFPTIERAYRRIVPKLAEQIANMSPPILQLPAPILTDDALARLEKEQAALIRLGLPKPCVDALCDWIRTGDDVELHRIQIRERARVWKLNEQDLLSVALHATRNGLLQMSWDTVCPHCRGVRDENGAMSDLAASGRCDACDVNFSTEAQESVEITFHVHPSIRDVPDQVYCSAEPAKKDHIRVQVKVPAGETIEIAPHLRPGRYTVWREHDGGWYLDVDHDHQVTEVAWEERDGGTVVEACPDSKIRLVHDQQEPQNFTIEEAKWSDHALRAGHLLSLQEFRDLFSAEYISSDVKLGVGEQTLLFTDVVGSTAFYASRGDPAAFMEIKKHFDELFAIVAEQRGAVIKTIGDAVMAAFGSPLDAVRAAQKIHLAFGPDRADTPIRLRVSLNTGPCIAVKLNANADYFGGTVNVAAKLQSLAEAYQIAMSETTYRSAGVAELMEAEKAHIDELTYTSKALPAPVHCRRWSVFPTPQT
ncbi:MAG TPA: adenylate/guanylate cyclase domain-containing protein [Kofleriaceae bacterium]